MAAYMASNVFSNPSFQRVSSTYNFIFVINTKSTTHQIAIWGPEGGQPQSLAEPHKWVSQEL